MDVACSLGWRFVGSVEVQGAALVMPELPSDPGIYLICYRHDGRERWYVGEAENLQARFARYASPDPTQSTNVRMKERTLRVAAAGGEVELHVAENVRLLVDGSGVVPDLGSSFVRRFVENAALVDLLARSGEIVNGEGFGSLRLDPVLG